MVREAVCFSFLFQRFPLNEAYAFAVAYRDLKLENVLLDSDGYCCIVDLGFAKVVTDKTYTLVGTVRIHCVENHLACSNFVLNSLFTARVSCTGSDYVQRL